MPKDILKALLKDVVNHGLTLVAFWCIQHGIFSPTAASSMNIEILALGVSTGLISLGLALYRKVQTHNWISFLHKAEPGAPISTIDKQVAALPPFTVLPSAK